MWWPCLCGLSLYGVITAGLLAHGLHFFSDFADVEGGLVGKDERCD